VLDVGAGAGIWSIEMGDAFPGAEVVGTDIAPTQPTWVPPNVEFIVEDAESSSGFPANHFDLVFGREITFAVKDWEQFVWQAFAALKPGG
jgi:ubiquinone/menaquinone biosynthesis C-methylase UbiE